MPDNTMQEITFDQLLPKVSPKPGVRYVPSQFALSFEYDQKPYLFHLLTRQNREGTLPREAYAGQGFDPLIEGRFLVPEDLDESAFYLSVFSMLRTLRWKKSSTFTILPTLACNARCFYCYEEGMPQPTMSPETVEQTIRYLIRNKPDGEMQLSWFGGEPLLRPDVLDRISEGLKAAGINFVSSVVTNGSLITPEIIRKMTGLWNVRHVQVTMDGSEQDYIKRKRYPVYRDYYHAVMEAASRMSEAGIRVVIRCNVDNDNVDHLPSLLQDLSVGVRNKSQVSFYCEQIFGEGRRTNDIAVREKIVALRPQIVAAGFRSAAKVPLPDELQVSFCMTTSDGVVITPDGSLYSCEHMPKEARFGDIRNDVTNDAARKEFARVDRIREKCKPCPYLPICTPFANCPVYHSIANCREIFERRVVDMLRERIEKKNAEESDEPITC